MSVKNLATELNHLTIQDELCPECGYNHDSEYESESYSESYSDEEQPQLCQVVGGALQGGAMRRKRRVVHRRMPIVRRRMPHRRMGRGMGDTYSQDIDGGNRYCIYTKVNSNKCARYRTASKKPKDFKAKRVTSQEQFDKYERSYAKAIAARPQKERVRKAKEHTGTAEQLEAARCNPWLNFVKSFRAQVPLPKGEPKWTLEEIGAEWQQLTEEEQGRFRYKNCKPAKAKKASKPRSKENPIIHLTR